MKKLCWGVAVAAVAFSAAADWTFGKREIRNGGVKADGITNGCYYVQADADEGQPHAVFLEGRILDFARASAVEERGGALRQTYEAGPVEVKAGDYFHFGQNVRIYSLTLSERPLAYAPQKVYTNVGAARDAAYAVRLDAFDDQTLKVTVRSRLGAVSRGDVTVVITDYWQREVARLEKKGVPLGRETSFELQYADNLTGQFLARVEVRDANGRTGERLFPRLGKVVRTAHREILRLNEGWERAEAKDAGTLESRTLRAEPPEKAAWQKVAFPSEVREALAWFRSERTIPASFAGRRIVLRIERMVGDGELYIDGRKAADLAKDLDFNGAHEVDVTDFVKPGAVQKFLIAARHSRFALLEPSELKEKNPNRLKVRGFVGLRSAIGETTLEARPDRQIGGVKVVTDYRNRRISVSAEHPDGLRVRNTVYRQDRKLLTFETSSAWQDPVLWGPFEFPLLRLVTELLDADGTVVDEKETRFGFREIWADGMKLMWNGHPVRGDARAFLSSWGWDFDRRCKRQENMDTLLFAKRRGVKFLRHIYNGSEHLDVCDELGLLVAKGGMTVSGPSPELSANAALWKTKTMNDLSMVRTFGNHPSVMTWYLSNEYYAEATDIHHKPVCAAILAVQAADPTRFAEAGCDIDVRGTMNFFSTHYPVELGAFRNCDCYMPDCFYWRPTGRDFVRGEAVPCGQVKDAANVPIKSPMKWGTKPIVINETCWDYFFGEPTGYSRIAGDEVFENLDFRDKWHMETDVEAVRGHRDAGAALWTTWRWFNGDDVGRVSPEVDVVNVQRYHAFYEGTDVAYDVNCFYDVWKPDALTWFWRLEDGAGRAVASGEKIRYEVDTASSERRKIAFVAPKAGRYLLRFGLEGRCEKTLKVTVFPKMAVPAADNVIAADMPLTQDVLKRAEAGETIVVLVRDGYPEWLPEIPAVTEYSAAILRTFRKGHPIVRGLSSDNLAYFYPNSIACRHGFAKPAGGNARTLLEFGGPSGLAYAALLEVPYGKGAFLYSRLVLEPERNPVAARLLQRMASYRRTAPGGKALLLGGTDEKLEQALKVNCGVTFENGEAADAAKYAAVLVDGTRTLEPDERAALERSGRTVFVFNPGPTYGLRTRPVKAKGWKGRAVVVAKDDPLLAGLTNQDLLWRAKYEDAATAAADLGSGEFTETEGVLLYPAYAVRKGNFVYLTADPKIRKTTVSAQARRFWSVLLGNAGLDLMPFAKPTMPKNLFFTPLDISSLFDRTLDDEKDNDGVGSWNDQGPGQRLTMRFAHPLGWVGKVPYRVVKDGPCAFALATEHRKGGRSNVVVRVNAKADTVNWLFSSAWTSRGKRHYTVRVRYADGTESVVHGRGGVNVSDCFAPRPDFSEELDTVTDFRSFPHPHKVFPVAHVFSTSWANPHPEKTIASVVFERGEDHCAVIGVFGVTLGAKTSEYAKLPKSEREKLHDRLVAEASAAQKENRLEDAIAAYEKAIRAVPERVWVYRSIGGIYEAMKDWDAALTTYRRSLEADYNQPDVWEAEKRMLKKLGRK